MRVKIFAGGGHCHRRLRGGRTSGFPRSGCELPSGPIRAHPSQPHRDVPTRCRRTRRPASRTPREPATPTREHPRPRLFLQRGSPAGGRRRRLSEKASQRVRVARRGETDRSGPRAVAPAYAGRRTTIRGAAGPAGRTSERQRWRMRLRRGTRNPIRPGSPECRWRLHLLRRMSGHRP